MKTTVEIPDELFRQAKARAALEGIKLKDLMVRGLQLALETPNTTGHRTVFPIIKSNRRDVLTVEQVQAALHGEEDQSVAQHLRR